MFIREEMLKALTRRQLFKNCVSGIGAVALASLMNETLFAAVPPAATPVIDPLAPQLPDYAANATHVDFLDLAPPRSSLYKPGRRFKVAPEWVRGPPTAWAPRTAIFPGSSC